MILFQLVVNVGMVIGIMPITGIPLPVRHPRRRLARQHRHRPGHPAEHQHPPDPRGVVTARERRLPAGRYARHVSRLDSPTAARLAAAEQASPLRRLGLCRRAPAGLRRIASISSRYGRPIGIRSSHSRYSRSARAISPSDQPAYRPKLRTLPDGLPGRRPGRAGPSRLAHRRVVAAADRRSAGGPVPRDVSARAGGAGAACARGPRPDGGCGVPRDAGGCARRTPAVRGAAPERARSRS